MGASRQLHQQIHSRWAVSPDEVLSTVARRVRRTQKVFYQHGSRWDKSDFLIAQHACRRVEVSARVHNVRVAEGTLCVRVASETVCTALGCWSIPTWFAVQRRRRRNLRVVLCMLCSASMGSRVSSPTILRRAPESGKRLFGKRVALALRGSIDWLESGRQKKRVLGAE